MIRLRGTLKRQGRKGLVLGAIALVSLAVLLAHSGPDGHQMQDDGMGMAVAICLAVLQGGGLVVLGLGLLRVSRRGRSSFAPERLPAAPFVPARHAASADPRAGPALLQVFLR